MAAMTRACATPARGSASLPGSERTTPTLPPRRSPSLRPSPSLCAADFGAKIRQLEETGCRLRGEVDGILKESRQNQIVARKRGLAPENRFSVPLSDRPSEDEPFSLHDLADISAEQRTITAMKNKLEEHSQQAESLHSRVHRPCSPARHTPVLPARRLDLMLPPSILERELREARQQNDFLKTQLDTSQRQHAAEAQEARHCIEDLKARLYDLQTNHEQQVRSQEEERQNHAGLVAGLRESLQQLQTANREQEQALLQTNSKVDQAQQNFYILESALSQLRGLLLNVEQRRGRPFFDTDPVQSQSGTMLVHCVERCLQEHAAELDLKVSKLRQMDLAMEEAKKMAESRLSDQERQQQEKLSALSRDADKRAQELREAEAACRRRADMAEERCRSVQLQMEETAQLARTQKAEYTSRIHELMAELERQENAWNERRAALEHALDAAQRDTAAATSQKEAAMKEAAESEASLQRSLADRAHTKAALEEETARRRHHGDQVVHLERQVASLAAQVEDSRLLVAALQKEAEVARTEAAAEVTRVRHEERGAVAKERDEAAARVAGLSAELEQTKAEVQEARAAFDQAQTALREATEGHNMSKIQLEGLADEKVHLQSIVGNRSAEVERLTSERDFYFTCLDDKTEEVSVLKAEKQRLIAQLEERLSDLKVLDQERAKQFGNCHHEKESLQVRFAEKDRELEALRCAKESLTRRLKAKEKQVKEMELERERGGKELQEQRCEVEAVFRERNQLFAELKESRQEALDMANEMEALRTAAREREVGLERQVREVDQRLVELQKPRRSLQPSARGANRGAGPRAGSRKEASTSRNQVTALQTKLAELEANALAVEEERRRLKAENARLVRLMERLTLQNEKLASEVEFYLARSQETAARLHASETEVQEADRRSTALQETCERLETEVTTLRCKLAAAPSRDVRPESGLPGPQAVSELGADLRHMLGDVRSLLAQHADPGAAEKELELERRRRQASPVGQLLVERRLPSKTRPGKDVRWHEEA